MNSLQIVVAVLLLGMCYGAYSAKPKNYKKREYQDITRVIGGQFTTEPIPYQVSLQNFVAKKWRHFCGGSIIGKSHVLTAVHCVDNMRPESMTVVAGTSNWKSGGFRYNVAAYVKHERYSTKGGYIVNDVAVIKVVPEFQFNQVTIAPISLALNFNRQMENTYPVTLTGWGVTDPVVHKILPTNLMILNYTTIPNSECQTKGFKVTPYELCAHVPTQQSACVGDSGGPLVNRERNIQIGIVSYGSSVCASGKPDVYVRVSNYVSWIQKTVRELIP